MNEKKGAGSSMTSGSSDMAAPPLTPFAAPNTLNMPPSGASRSAFHPDVPSRSGAMGPGPTAGAQDSTDFIEPNRLIIGREVKIKGGKITSCDRLSLEGEVEDINLSRARLLEVAPVGTFRGNAEVDEAIVGGRFEGELTAHNRLTIKAGGSVNGIVRYGSIAIEPGGSISGEMQALTEQSDS